ncbi:MAG: DUF3710 domain-containing protein [Mycobacteriales bacterium]
MALRRSRRRRDEAGSADGPAETSAQEPPAGSGTGPWDKAHAPQDDLERLDLGALRVPVVPGYDVQVEVSPEGQVVSINLLGPGGGMQLGAFAAPKSSGIWADIRREILTGISSQGGTGQESEGAFGPELSVLAPVPGGHQRLRFIGVDGPRWFLRAVLSGPAATDAAQAADLEDTLRRVVVDRGDAPMPVRDALPLVLPKEIAEQIAEQDGSAPDPPDGAPGA